MLNAAGRQLTFIVIAINPANDRVNPPESGILERAIARVPGGRMVVIPRGSGSVGHGSYLVGSLYKEYLTELLTRKRDHNWARASAVRHSC
jgi:homoserine O-acetyltransferase